MLAVLAILGCVTPVQPVTCDSPGFDVQPARRQIKWPRGTIRVSLSTSLSAPGAASKSDSDVVGVVHRALHSWSKVAQVTFVAVGSQIQSISPVNEGDGVSLITIAETPENLALFEAGHNPARTRVFYDTETGHIVEADIVINPHPTSEEGIPLKFSTDGTPGTYDLESTLTHEVGHLLGLEHSRVLASTMQARQGINGVYKLPAFTERTLTEDDTSRVRSIYGPHEGLGAIAGKVMSVASGSGPTPLQAAHVWVEDSLSGRVVGSTVTSSSGNYRIDCIPPGQYRLLTEYINDSVSPGSSSEGVATNSLLVQPSFRATEINNQVSVSPNVASNVNFVLVPPQSGPSFLRPRLIGTNGELSTVPVPAGAGRRLTIYVGGEGVDQVPVDGISVTSPYMAVDPDTLRREQFSTSFPVIGFDVTVAPNVTFGDFSLRLQSNSGEVAYVAGGITIDPAVDLASRDDADDPKFFISRFQDFLAREQDQDGLDYRVREFAPCGSDVEHLQPKAVREAEPVAE